MPSSYLLPFHPSLTSDDPLDLYNGGDDPFVSQAALLKQLLEDAQAALAEDPNAAPKIFISLIENIAYTIQGNGSLSTTTLSHFLVNKLSPEEAERAIWNIIQSAFELKAPAQSQELGYLSDQNKVIEIRDITANSLLAHQALGTLNIPDGNTWGQPGFLSWYADSPHHPNAVQGYLRTLFIYFQRPVVNGTSFTFSLHDAIGMPDPISCDWRPDFAIDVVNAIREPAEMMVGPIPFVLIAANREPGPGPTGTQEERLQASSPVLTLSSLLCPVIPDNAAIATSALPVLASWTGHNRSARLVHIYDKEKRPYRHYILADALPLDEHDGTSEEKLPDLLPRNIEREVKKLYAGFSGASALSRQICQSEPTIDTPPWGCGAFGGNIVVKTICMMIAAGLAKVPVRLSVTNDIMDDIGVLRKLQAKDLTVAALWKIVSDETCCDVQDVLRLAGAN